MTDQEAITIIRERMSTEKLSLRAAARSMGVSPAFLSQILSGKFKVSNKVLNWVGLEKVVLIRVIGE